MLAEQNFEKLGFTTKEIKAFLSLAEVGKATASVIGKKSGIPRSTVYTVLEGLMERGLVSLEHSSGTAYYVANDPSSLGRMIDKEEEDLKEKRKTVNELIEAITPYIKSSSHSLPKLQYFEGKRNVENMLFRYLQPWRKSFAPANDFTTWGFVDHSLHSEYKRWTLHRIGLLKPGGDEKIKLFSNREALDQQLKKRFPEREIKILPKDIEISCSVLLYGEYIIMLMTREKPHCAFQLHNPVFAKNLRSVFKLLWSLT
jgi:sugar-specific transcriptional regulator TrmB